MIAGYRLRRIADDEIVATWGGVFGQCPGLPSPLYIDGLHVHGATVGEVIHGHVLEAWNMGPDVAAVRQEAQRRIISLTGASDLNSCIIRQLNALMRGTELTNKVAAGGTLTEAEQAEASALQALADSIKAIRAASNAIEVMNPIPEDYADSARWS